MEKNTILGIKNKLNVLKNQCKPTDTWQIYLDDDGDIGVFYTQEGINEVSNTLDNFIQSLINMDGYNDSITVEELIQKLIIELNNASHKYNGMIETNEREDLVDFIHSILDIVEYDYNGDITEQWREW